jgi:serine/threonine-protein phosphatase 2B catalytic subunit
VIVGDIHGQYYDLCHMLEKAGAPGDINYLFLGDYVDRGVYGVECMLLLMAIKLNYPANVILLRGNHESRNMTENFTFRSECIARYDMDTYNLMMELFDSMPLACIVDGKYFGMHGGISPELLKLDQIDKINRFQEVPLDGIFCDLLWADPLPDELATGKEYIDNEERECSYLFGKKPTKKLLDSNNLMTIVRGHQVQIEGYKMHRWDGPQSFPYVITIFSAPNYCGYYENKASVLIIDKGNLSLKQYEESDPPYRLPDNMDVFSWSMPFLAEKVTSLIMNIVRRGVGEDGDEDATDVDLQALVNSGNKKSVIKGKIGSIARISRMYTTLREESEMLLKIKNISPDGKLPRGLLLAGKPAIKNGNPQN